MRNLVRSLIILFFSVQANAQPEGATYKKAVAKFIGHYNRDTYDSIFSLFSKEMAEALPLLKARSFFEEAKGQAGKVLSAKFEHYEATYALYKTLCERRTLGLYISVNSGGQINGLYLQPYVANDLPPMKRNTTKLILPFDKVWTVMWGGDTKDLNYHVEVPVQKHAFDFIIKDASGKSYRTDSKTNEDYYAFGKAITAPCDAEVVLAVDGVPDNIPGQVNPMFVTGNTIILKTGKGEYLVLAHFKKHSIKVKEGERVKSGQLLGLCGNSGNSSEPHLHFHIQNGEDLNTAIGVKCYFDKISVNGVLKEEYSPVRNEQVKNKPE